MCHLVPYLYIVCSYETACEEYIKSLKQLQAAEEDKKTAPLQKSMQAPVMEFIVNRVRKLAAYAVPYTYMYVYII